MKRIQLIVTIVLLAALSIDAKCYFVVDSIDKSPVAGATVIGQSGVIKGLTDSRGCICVSDSELPVSIRCVGYEPVVTSTTNDTISLAVSAYRLDEVVVSPADRPVKRVLCFAREYSSGLTTSDTMQYYCEYMAEAYVVDGKVKGYRGADAKPTAKNYQRYARISKNGVDSIFKPKRGDDITELSWFDFMAFLPTDKIKVPAAILDGATSDTIQGKYGPKYVYQKKNGLFTVTADVLADHKDRRWSPMIFKLIGMTIDITDGVWTMSYADNKANTFTGNELISGTYNMHLIGRGKWIKKVFDTKEPIEMDIYMELYPLEITNLTVDEYKEMRDDFTPIPFQYPDNINPLSPAIDNLVKQLDRQ